MTLLLLLTGTGEESLTQVRLLPGCSAEISTLDCANKVYVKVEGTATVGTATNTTVAPTYADSPREMLVSIKAGDATAAAAVAALHLAVRQEERTKITGLQVPLRYGLGIERGCEVSVTIPRAGITAQSYPVRKLSHDFKSNVTTVDVGDYHQAQTAEDAQVELALLLAKLEKEAAI